MNVGYMYGMVQKKRHVVLVQLRFEYKLPLASSFPDLSEL